MKLLEADEIEEFNRLPNETEIALKLRKIDLSARVLIDADHTGAEEDITRLLSIHNKYRKTGREFN